MTHGIRGALSRRAMLALSAAVVMVGASLSPQAARAADPIRLGFSMPLTGPLAPNGKAALLALQMWSEDVNAKGGLLGREVKLVYYDDQSTPSAVPGMYTKLIEVDKVDLIISSYGTTQMIPAIPLAMQKGMVMMGLIGMTPNEKFKYDRFFQIAPLGPDPRTEVPRGFFDVAMAQDPKPTTVAITGVDVEYGKVAMDGARELAAKHGLKVVYDKSYPANVVDLTPIVRAIQVTKPDLVFVASYPTDSAGFIKSVTELNYKPKMIGGGMIGLQYAALKTQLGPLLNGVVNYELYAPEPSMNFPGIQDFLQRYQAKAAKEGVDPLGFYVPPYVYAAAQVMQNAIQSTGSLDQAKIAEHIRGDEFDTVVGKIRFGENGEWAKPRPLLVQYQNIKGNGIEQFFKAGVQPIMHPPALKSGNMIYPYAGPGQ
jgi:branched-chain amino acid transport system substrate-binding protein